MAGTYRADDADDGAPDDLADDLATNKRLIARFHRAGAAGESDLLDAWIEFGRHNWVWQMLHRKPRAAS